MALHTVKLPPSGIGPPETAISGVTTVTVLTKPYPCPGKCIFCPTDVRMPKSYLPDEPGAMRAVEHQFDPYAQVRSRIMQLESLGHPTDKIELLILGGTWSSYKRDYQEWFVGRCFEAMNNTASGNSQTGERRLALSRVEGLEIDSGQVVPRVLSKSLAEYNFINSMN